MSSLSYRSALNPCAAIFSPAQAQSSNCLPATTSPVQAKALNPHAAVFIPTKAVVPMPIPTLTSPLSAMIPPTQAAAASPVISTSIPKSKLQYLKDKLLQKANEQSSLYESILGNEGFQIMGATDGITSTGTSSDGNGAGDRLVGRNQGNWNGEFVAPGYERFGLENVGQVELLSSGIGGAAKEVLGRLEDDEDARCGEFGFRLYDCASWEDVERMMFSLNGMLADMQETSRE